MIPICHVQLLPILSGVQRAMLDIFRHLDRRRYQPHVVCCGPGPLSEELLRLSIPCHFVPCLVRPIRPRRDFAATCALASLFRRQGFQLVHTHSSKPGFVGRLAARWAGVPHVLHHVQGFAFHEFSGPLARAVYSRLERSAGGYCDRVIFVSHEERELAIRSGILPAEKCLTVYNGVDLKCFSPERSHRTAFRRELGLAEHEVAIAFVGRLEPQKQPAILPELASRLHSLCPRAPWRMLVAGAGPFHATLARRVREMGLSKRVQLLGWVTPPERVFHAADVVLLPSLWEGLPLTLLEAQATGLPIVASNIKGNREVVTVDTGFLCSPRAAADYAGRLAMLVADAGQRQAFGLAARRRAEQFFDSGKNMRRIAALYDALLWTEASESDGLSRVA